MNNRARMEIGVVFGGRSGEHAVSLLSARSIIAALDPERYSVLQIGLSRDGQWWVGSDPQVNVLDQLDGAAQTALTPALLPPSPKSAGIYKMKSIGGGARLEFLSKLDVVFPVLHGTFGEDGTMQGLFELADLPYVGAGVLGSAVAMDKGVFKDVMIAHQIPVLESVCVSRSEIKQNVDAVIHQVEAMAPYPVFTKPANMGSSVGISKCQNRSDLLEGLMEAASFDRRILIERGISGREIEVSVIGNESPKASIAGEIIPYGDFYTYESKYHDDRSQLIIPAPISDVQMGQVRDYAVQAYRAIDCAGFARVDFLMEKETEEVYLNEINTIPGFTRISMFPKLWAASGVPYPELLDRLIQLALDRKRDRDETVREYYREAVI